MRRRIGQVLGDGDLEVLAGALLVAAVGEEVGEAEEVLGVEGVAPQLLAERLLERARARRARVAPHALGLRQRQLDAMFFRIKRRAIS